MRNDTYIFLVKLFAPLALVGTVVAMGMYAWDTREERAWRELDVRWRRQLFRERRALRRLEREDG